MAIEAKTTLELTEEERAALKAALSKYLSDLRLVIAATESGREPLKDEKELLQGIVERL